MRRIILSLLGAAVLSAGSIETASAQDILRALYSSRPVANWTGPYLGGNFGYGWGKIDTDATGLNAPSPASNTVKGILGGLQGGANMQSGIWVFGVEADIQASSLKSDVLTTLGGLPITDSAKMQWFGTARVRAGVAADTVLFYLTGGLAYGEYKRNIQFVGFTNTFLDHSTLKTGWTLGGGIEGMFSRNWGWRVEYLHLHFGTFNEDFNVFNGAGALIGTNTMNTKLTNDIFRFGVNYFFH